MDPVSHVTLARTLIGVLGRADDGASPRAAIAAAMLGALSPDIDSVLMPFGWDRYLRAHEVGTHTIAGTFVCGLLTAAVVWIVARREYARLVFAAWIGAVSHVVLDLLSSARLRPGWPIVDSVVSLPVVAMADPWLLSLCVAGALAFWVARGRRSRKVGVLVLAAIAGFAIGKGLACASAFAGYAAARDRAGETVAARAVEAEWASLTAWRVLDRTPRRLRIWEARTGRESRLALSWTLEEDSPLIAASREFSTVRNFLRAHDLVFASVVPQPDGHALVLWSDIRFCWNPDAPGAARLEPIVTSRDGARIACALWFGGEVSANGQRRREIVKVGGFTQTR